jgi:hypothetical protein
LHHIAGNNGIGIYTIHAAFTNAGATTIDLTGTIRDFSSAHPDFEMNPYGAATGMVESTLGLTAGNDCSLPNVTLTNPTSVSIPRSS